MTFIETFGGSWETKSQMSAGDAFRFLQVVPKLHLSAKFMAKMGALGASGKPFITKITEVGDGIYALRAEAGDLASDARLAYFHFDGYETGLLEIRLNNSAINSMFEISILG